MKLKRYGFFEELPHGDSDGGRLSSLRGAAHYDDAQLHRIVRYLNRCTLFVACPGLVTDVLVTGSTPLCAPHLLTDGDWVWPADLAYYVEKHLVPIPAAMLQAMERNDWTPPDAIDIASLEV